MKEWQWRLLTFWLTMLEVSLVGALFIGSTFVPRPIGSSLVSGLSSFLAVFPYFFYLYHVIHIYDRENNPEYTEIILRRGERCQHPRCHLAKWLVLVLMGLWIFPAYLLVRSPDIWVFPAFIGGLAFFLDGRKGWLGARSLFVDLLDRRGREEA